MSSIAFNDRMMHGNGTTNTIARLEYTIECSHAGLSVFREWIDRWPQRLLGAPHIPIRSGGRPHTSAQVTSIPADNRRLKLNC